MTCLKSRLTLVVIAIVSLLAVCAGCNETRAEGSQKTNAFVVVVENRDASAIYSLRSKISKEQKADLEEGLAKFDGIKTVLVHDGCQVSIIRNPAHTQDEVDAKVLGFLKKYYKARETRVFYKHSIEQVDLDQRISRLSR